MGRGHVGGAEKDGRLADEFFVAQAAFLVVRSARGSRARRCLARGSPGDGGSSPALPLPAPRQNLATPRTVRETRSFGHQGADANLMVQRNPAGDHVAQAAGRLGIVHPEQQRAGDAEHVLPHFFGNVADFARLPSRQQFVGQSRDRIAVVADRSETERLLDDAAVTPMLLAVHRQQAARAATLGGSPWSANREKASVKSLGIGQNLLVVFGAEQKDDALSASSIAAIGPCSSCRRRKLPKQIARELGEIDATDRQSRRLGAQCLRETVRMDGSTTAAM